MRRCASGDLLGSMSWPLSWIFAFVFGANEVLGRFELTFIVGLAHIVLRVTIAQIPRWVIGIHPQRYLVVPVVILLAYHSLSRDQPSSVDTCLCVS